MSSTCIRISEDNDHVKVIKKLGFELNGFILNGKCIYILIRNKTNIASSHSIEELLTCAKIFDLGMNFQWQQEHKKES